MDTTESPRTRLSSVQDLLRRLNELKNTGIGARERLDLLLDEGSELIDNFNYEDVFDLELRARSKRLEKIVKLGEVMRTLEAHWNSSPLSDDVKEGGRGLMKHLHGFVKDAESRERDTELDMLGQVWQSDPDISHVYPWLTAWKKPRRWAAPPEEVQELIKHKDDLYADVAKEEDEKAIREVSERLDKLNKKCGDLGEIQDDSDQSAPKEMKVIKEYSEAATSDQVVSSVHGTPPPAPPEEVDHLRRDAWTEALRETTVDAWQFHREVEVPDGEVLLWTAPGSEARLELSTAKTSSEKLTGYLVNLRILQKGKRGKLHKYEEVMSPEAVKELHLDPRSFVKKALDD